MATCPTCRKAFASGTFCPQDGARLVDETTDGSVVLDNRYRLLRKVGSGGMGEVYEAEHIHIHRKVAVKILRPEIASDVDAIARLKREAQTTSGLGHPNIVDTFDFGHAEGQAYLVMEWLDGVNLDNRLGRGPIDVATALEIGAQAAAGLAEAHAHGVIHRDVKPANLFLTTDRRGALVVKVVDFGIAKLAMSQVSLTATGVLIGTPNYMAPEQAMGEPIDERTDVYALGVILYEMVTGTPPFRGETPLAVLHQHTSKLPMPPSESAVDRGISSDVEAIILRCLHKRPDERFQTMKDLARALEAVRGIVGGVQPVVAPREAPVERAPAITRGAVADEDDEALLAASAPRRGRMLIVLGVFAVVAAGIIVFAVRRGKQDPPGRGADRVAASHDGSLDGAGTTPDDAVVVAGADAAGAVDAANAPDAASVAWHHEAGGRRFSLRASSAVPPTAGEKLDLVIEIFNAPRSVATPRVALSIQYFRDHSVVHSSSHDLGTDGRVAATVPPTKVGKHHVRVDLLDGDRKIDTARFDIHFER
ncbi:MAG: serine/threonine protein kinase [Myxococcota bacterium]|nr:serine/threonine protein kinase [Deltaproteobacteria bacterium]MDQ3336635.1 serine/threonine protein kinase [Myxococcota bacterium]